MQNLTFYSSKLRLVLSLDSILLSCIEPELHFLQIGYQYSLLPQRLNLTAASYSVPIQKNL
jgi:hypothetical protein